MLKARYTMIGGFLGAGKTTAILQIAQRLQAQGLRVGLITNDQSIGLVDTAMLSSQGFPTEEINGGCFCCKFNSLIEAAQRLTADVRPDVFLAEPVGSCTDLVATVSFPLRRIYGDEYSIAPLSVMVDPIRAQRILGLKEGSAFSPKVRYIYSKQLEEAEIIVLNKCDLLDAGAMQELDAAVRKTYPKAKVAAVSARGGEGIAQWMEMIETAESESDKAMEVDYDTYADGEAMLGWLNVSARIEGEQFDGNRLLATLIQSIGQQLADQSIDVAHLKSTLVPSEGNDIAVANLVRNDAPAELAYRLAEPLESGELIINLRAEGDPAILEQTAVGVLHTAAEPLRLSVAIQHTEAFRPARPTPTHRVADGQAI